MRCDRGWGRGGGGGVREGGLRVSWWLWEDRCGSSDKAQ